MIEQAKALATQLRIPHICVSTEQIADTIDALCADIENLQYKQDYWKRMHDELKSATISESQALRAEVERHKLKVQSALEDLAQAHADRRQLRAEVELLRTSWGTMAKVAKETADINDRLSAEVESLRKDAERYRWLRSSNNMEAADFLDMYFEEQLDAAIDAAMQGVEE